jgi:hypothetical protein
MCCQRPRRPSEAARFEHAVLASRAGRDARCGATSIGASAVAASVAGGVGAARSTLQDWLGQAPSDEMPAALRQVYASEEGVVWLHHQVSGARLVITLLAGAGFRDVCTFLELSGLRWLSR